MVCTFFGHRHTPDSVRKVLINTITELIENRGVDTFYVGNHGGYDCMVRSVLKELKDKYSHICYSVVLAHMPREKYEFEYRDFSDMMYPEGLETVPKRFAISKRNEWMVNNSDIVVAYVIGSIGGAAQFVDYARRKKKEIINLADMI